MATGTPIAWDYGLLKKLYVGERLKIKSIALRFGVSPVSVHRALIAGRIVRTKKKEVE